jgi:hypothetical protein
MWRPPTTAVGHTIPILTSLKVQPWISHLTLAHDRRGPPDRNSNEFSGFSKVLCDAKIGRKGVGCTESRFPRREAAPSRHLETDPLRHPEESLTLSALAAVIWAPLAGA